MHLVIGLALAAAVVVLLSKLPLTGDTEDLRRRELAALARRLRLHFNPDGDFERAKNYLFLRWLNRGGNQCLYNLYRGCYCQFPVVIFDYTFTAGKSTYYWSAYVLEMSTNFPDLLISHETWEARIAEMLGKEHLTFESAEFSRVFRVRSAEKKFAFDICHPQMMEFLLANPDLTIEIRGSSLAILFETWLDPQKIEHDLSRLIAIRKFLPEYLFVKA